MFNTNVLFSALLFPNSKPATALFYVAHNHEIVLCDRNITEFRNILERKAPQFLSDADVRISLPLDIAHFVYQFLDIIFS